MSISRKQRARVEINKLATSFVAYDEGDPETPVEGLLREIQRSGQIAKAYAEAIEHLQDDEVTSAIGQHLHVFIEAWERERVTHARLCDLALRAGVEQRQLDIVERQAGALVEVILALLQHPRLRLNAEQIAEGKIVAAGLLRLPTGLNC